MIRREYSIIFFFEYLAEKQFLRTIDRFAEFWRVIIIQLLSFCIYIIIRNEFVNIQHKELSSERTCRLVLPRRLVLIVYIVCPWVNVFVPEDFNQINCVLQFSHELPSINYCICYGHSVLFVLLCDILLVILMCSYHLICN